MQLVAQPLAACQAVSDSRLLRFAMCPTILSLAQGSAADVHLAVIKGRACLFTSLKNPVQYTLLKQAHDSCMTLQDIKLSISLPAENPPLPKGFAGLAVETLVLAPTLFQQLDMHFLAMNNTLNSSTMYIIFMGK